ncbi:MAG: hypothetical protein U0234_30595 [Sandaracinus sp.]
MHAPFSTPPQYVHETERGKVELWIDRPGWLLSRARGHFEVGHCVTMLSAGDEALRLAAPIRFVHDWRELTGFEAITAAYLVRWAARNARSVEHSTIITRSPIVAMAVRAANVTLKNLLLVATEDKWLERAFTLW